MAVGDVFSANSSIAAAAYLGVQVFSAGLREDVTQSVNVTLWEDSGTDGILWEDSGTDLVTWEA